MDNNSNHTEENVENIDETSEEIQEKVEEKEPPKQPGRGLLDWAQALAMAIAVIVIVFTFFARIIGVDGDSMNPTLINNDRLIISHVAYHPTAGDIVVIHVDNYSAPLIKRIIALEGQTIRFEPSDGKSYKVYVDGVAQNEPYIAEKVQKTYDLPASVDIRVPEGCVFVMGDNRNHSSDSRSDSVGMVDERQIIGKALFRLFPFSSFGGI